MPGEVSGAETMQRPDTCSLETRRRQSDEVEVRRRRYVALHRRFPALTHARDLELDPGHALPRRTERTTLCKGPVVWCTLI